MSTRVVLSRRWVAFTLPGLAVASMAISARADFETPIAITGVRIVTGTGETIASGTIVMDGGRFIAVGADVKAPPQAEILDGTGLTAYPGFIDAMSYLGVPAERRAKDQRERWEDENPDPREGPLPQTRLANRRGIRPSVRAVDLFVPKKDALDQARRVGFTTVSVAPRAGIFGGRGDLLSLSGLPLRRSVVASDVGMYASFTTGEGGEYPQTLLGGIAQFRQVLLDARWTVQMRRYAERHPRTAPRVPADESLDALLPMLRREQPIIFEANSEREIHRALNLCAEYNLNVIISGAREAWKVSDRLRDERVPVIVSLKFDEEPEYGKKKKTSAGRGRGASGARGSRATHPSAHADHDAARDGDESPPQRPPDAPESEKPSTHEERLYEPLKVRQERRRLWEEQVANVIRLDEAGIPFALRSSDLKDPEEFIKNLKRVIERGLSPETALRALTTVPADILGVQTQLGAIARDRQANLVLTTGDVFAEESKVRYVFADGHKFEYNRKDEEDHEAGNDGDDGDDDDKAASEPPPRQPPRDVTARTEAPDQPPRDVTVRTETPHQPPRDVTARTEAPDQSPRDVTARTETPTTKEREEASPDELEEGPTWASETVADRIPDLKTGGNVVIQNATVITVSGDTLRDASVLIVDGRIQALGQILTVPDGVTVIDGTGRFVIPGFVDAHSHLGIDGTNESALAISAEVRVGDLINPSSVSIFRAAAGGTTTNHAMHGSANPIGGQNVIFKLKYERPVEQMLIDDAPRTIKFALGENVIQSNRQRAWGKRFPNSRTGVEALFRRAFERARDYRREWDAFRAAERGGRDIPPPRRDLRLEARDGVLSGDITVHCHCYRSDEILRLLDVFEEYGVRVGVLQHVLEGYRVMPEIARHGAAASTFSDFWAYKVEAYEAIPYNAAMMEAYGICTSINSDSPNTIRYLGLEAAKAIRWGGLDPIEALKLVTLNPARQLQIDRHVGSIEVGKDGDLAIFNGHPLNTFSKCIMTIIDGEVFFVDPRPEPIVDASTLDVPTHVDRTIPRTVHRAFAITNATVHTMSGPVIERGTVVILDDDIHDVGADVTVPPGAGVIDGTGLHVYPGIIDAGTTLGLTEVGSLRATNMNREIGTFEPDVRAATAVHPFSTHIRTARASGITTALTQPSGGAIAGQSAIIRLDGWTAAEMLIDDAFALHVTVPSLPAHVPGKDRKKRAAEHEKRLRALDEFIEQAAHYADVRDLARDDPAITFETDRRLEAMIPYVRGEKPVIFHADGYKAILDTLEFARKHDLKCIISGASDAWKAATELADQDVPVILNTPVARVPRAFDPWDSAYRNAGVLERAGVTFAFGSGGASGAMNLPLAVGMGVAHGLTPQRAERALTLDAARILGIADRVGSIEVGKRADLIVTTGTPLQTVTQITHVFIRGNPVDLTSKHTRNYELFSHRPEPRLPPPPENLRGPASFTRQD